jgi:hypothetical protein
MAKIPVFECASDLANYLKEQNPKNITCSFLRKDGTASVIFVHMHEGLLLATAEALVQMVERETDKG